MAVRLPGAANAGAYWRNLREGVCSIRKLNPDELEAAGVAPNVLGRPDYVPFAAPLEEFDQFDADFFGLSPKEAAIMDPQHRQFLELSWEALEGAGHVPENFPGKIGVYAGSGMGSYFYFNICSNPDLINGTGMFLLRHTGNDKDFLSTRVSHVLDLKGPSVNLQTACSTSLVAVHYAAQALLSGECDMALAGGVTIELPQGQGYIFKENEVLSPDGQCHAFDHRAAGTVFGSGAGVVALRRLEDAVRDGDAIWAVIKGSAINNDGGDKAGYLAPSVGGQADAISAALQAAGTGAETIDYVECHGTGTYLGDPIEVAALTEAYRRTTDATGYCRIGSVKTNIGHLDTAAGVASLAKASLALHNGEIPASLGFERPNPAIDFDGSPFVVNDRLTPWPRRDHPRRAGINSLGVGGTNAHVILEEAPDEAASEESIWPFQLLTLSARNEATLDAAAGRLASYLDESQERLADVAFTLKEGRKGFERRRVVVAATAAEASALLREMDPTRVFTHSVVAKNPAIVFMFPGGGAQYAGMARDLYETEPVFREWMDKGLAALEPKLDYNIRAVWLPEADAVAEANERLKTPSVQLPLIMIVEYALAQLAISWGVKPSAFIGHSMGENTAACLAGVMSFEDCIGLVHLRGRLFDSVPGGGMLSVALSEDDLRPLLGQELDIAAVNAPGLTVATGPAEALEKLENVLADRETDCQRIAINVAAHSRLLEPILEDFRSYLASIALNAPEIPLISNLTGKWITEEEATDPNYWVDHLRSTVRFNDGLATLAESPERVYLEVGPGRALAALAAQNPGINRNQVIRTLRDPRDVISDDAYFVGMLGRIWATGGDFDWTQIWAGAARRRLRLPTYPFQHRRYYIEPGDTSQTSPEQQWLMRTENRDEWNWQPYWKPTYAECLIDISSELNQAQKERWLIFVDDTGLGMTLVERLRTAGHQVTTVRPGDTFARVGEDDYILAPELGGEAYEQLVDELSARDVMPTRMAHLWLVTGNERSRPGSSFFHRLQEQGFWSLHYFVRAWAGSDGGALHITVVTSDAEKVRDEKLRYPEKSTVMGPAKVIPREFPNITCNVLDLGNAGRDKAKSAAGQVLEEILSEPANTVAAIRDGKRYEQRWRRIPLADRDDVSIETGSVVMLTGGLGGIGLAVADALIRQHGARIAFVARSKMPARNEWEAKLERLPSSDPLAVKLQALMAIEEAGGEFMLVDADVSNIEDMRSAVGRIRDRLGPVRGVVHAAGMMDDAPMLSKSTASVDEVLTPKVYGTQVLASLFPDGALDWMVLFSSSSTVTAPAGQVDYVAANAYLNAFANSRAGGDTRVVAIDWGVWADVGMAADAIHGRTSRTRATPAPVDQPLFDGATNDEAGNRRFVANWRTADQWVLNDHRTKAGDALLPGTGYLELAAEALAAQGETNTFEIRDLTFLRPLRTSDDTATSVRVTLPRTSSSYDMLVESSADGETFEVNAEAELRLLPMAPPAPVDFALITGRCPRLVHAGEGEMLRAPQEAHLRFGPRWQVLKSMRFGDAEGVAQLVLPQGDTAYHLHPGVMDLATGWAVELIEDYSPEQFWVPVSYRSVRVFGPLPTTVTSWVRLVETSTGTAQFDISICAPDGVVCVEIEGFSIRRLAANFRFAAPPSTKTAQVRRPLSRGEERLRHNVSQGIPTEDGAAAFFRALATGVPQVVVSSLDLEKLVAQTEFDARPRKSQNQTFERPDLDSDYVEPEGEIERRLAAFWTELLGVEKVGAEDDFFDLGGHSLIAVRLFAMVKSAFAVDFPISILFEAPTIRKCATMIAERRGPTTETQESVVTSIRTERRFAHIVPMHQGEGGPKTPFFLVAGMFGNVLNLRHLAYLLGTDRPFYGLQARGLLGGDPHDDLVDAARDYIREMRMVQPKGPYMVGGFSGGGITAYEIARQLTAEGEDVAALVLLDTPLPRRARLTWHDRVTIQRKRLVEEGPVYLYRWLRRRIEWEFTKRRTREFETSQTEFHNTVIEAAFYRAVGTYEVGPWDGPLTLFRPPLDLKWETAPGRWVNSKRELVNEANDWRPFASKIEVIEVPGDHDSMVLEPNVRVLATRMRRIVDAAEPRGSAAEAARRLRAAE